MNDEELMLGLCEAIEKLESVEAATDDDYLLLRAALETVREVRDELRFGLGDI